jgi:hypothetical protein
MTSLPSLTDTIHIVFGFLVFWILQGWAVVDETLAPDMPSTDQPGRFGFVIGQGLALLAQSSLALLCAHALSPLVDTHDLVFLPLGIVGILYLLESVWIVSGSSLPSERRPMEFLSFAHGRDLIMRHASALFLAQGLLATVQGSRSAALQAGGAVLGWGLSVVLWDFKANRSAVRATRWVMAAFSLLIGILVSRQAWNNF